MRWSGHELPKNNVHQPQYHASDDRGFLAGDRGVGALAIARFQRLAMIQRRDSGGRCDRNDNGVVIEVRGVSTLNQGWMEIHRRVEPPACRSATMVDQKKICLDLGVRAGVTTIRNRFLRHQRISVVFRRASCSAAKHGSILSA